MSDCIFCKIIAGDIPPTKVYEDETILAFRDIAPQAPTHILVVPKTHIEDTDGITSENSGLIAHIFEIIPAIAKAEGVETVIVGRLYASGCTLQQHVEAANTGSNFYQYTKFTDEGRTVMEGIPLKYGLEDEDWDIIFTQQGAAYAPLVNSYGNYIDQLMPYLQENKTNPNARFVWNMTWAYQGNSEQKVFVQNFNSDQMAMYESILSATKEKIVPRTDFAAIIPSGTAVQNARTSYFGDTLTKDTYHLNNLGRAIAGYTLFSILTGKELTQVNLGPVNCYDLPQNLELTDSDRQVIIESVNNAIKNPWEVTPSAFTEKP